MTKLIQCPYKKEPVLERECFAAFRDTYFEGKKPKRSSRCFGCRMGVVVRLTRAKVEKISPQRITYYLKGLAKE